MGNHYHLLLETPEPNLVAGMKWLQGTYSIRFNFRRMLPGIFSKAVTRQCCSIRNAANGRRGPRREHTEGEAERLVGRALQALGVKDEDLPRMRKSDPRKIMMF
jgi:hypothetical protein